MRSILTPGTLVLCMSMVFVISLCISEADASEADREWMDKNVRINQIQVLGSHNSYKEAIAPVLMGVIMADDPKLARELDYSHVSLTEQLDLGLRKLELDIYYDPKGGLFARPYGYYGLREVGLPAGPEYDPEGIMLQPGFKVLHIQDIDFRSNCPLFKSGLEEIRAWSEAHPDHFPIIITMNTNDKIIDRPNFTRPIPYDAEAYDALDKEILEVFPAEELITPDDVRGDYDTLEEAVLANQWPTLGEARGKLMFVLDQSGRKMQIYIKDHPSLKGRVLFVNAKEGNPEAAFRIINDPIGDQEYIQRLVKLGYLVRTRADAGTEEARRGNYGRFAAALSSGAHFISTDYYYPNARFGTNYQIKMPGGGVARWNPLLPPEKNESPPTE